MNYATPAINPSIRVLADGSALGQRTDVDFVGFAVTDNPNSGLVRVQAPTPGLNVLDRNVATVVVDNDVETTLAGFVIPAGTLDINGRKVVLDQRGDIFNNGSTRSSIWRVYFGGVLAWGDTLSLQGISARRPFQWRHELVRIGSSSQEYFGDMQIASPNNALPTQAGLGTFNGGDGQGFAMYGPGLALDPDAAIDIRVTVQQSFTTANMITTQQTFQVSVE